MPTRIGINGFGRVGRLVFVLSALPASIGQAKKQQAFSGILSNSPGINRLSLACLALFAARDVWFVVSVPIVLLAYSEAERGLLLHGERVRPLARHAAVRRPVSASRCDSVAVGCSRARRGGWHWRAVSAARQRTCSLVGRCKGR
jgi:hypothetical protein